MGGCMSVDSEIESSVSTHETTTTKSLISPTHKVGDVQADPEVVVAEATEEEVTICKIQQYQSKVRNYKRKALADIEKYTNDATEAVNNKDVKKAKVFLAAKKIEETSANNYEKVIDYLEDKISFINSTKEQIDLANTLKETLQKVDEITTETKKYGDLDTYLDKLRDHDEADQDALDSIHSLIGDNVNSEDLDEELDLLIKQEDAKRVVVPTASSTPLPPIENTNSILPTPPSGFADPQRVSYIPINNGISSATLNENTEEDIPLPEINEEDEEEAIPIPE